MKVHLDWFDIIVEAIWGWCQRNGHRLRGSVQGILGRGSANSVD